MATTELDGAPTWADVLPALVAVLEGGTAVGRTAAREELANMAKCADRWNAFVVEVREDTSREP